MTLFHKIGILGLGLIGGSIAKCLKKKAVETHISTVKREDEDQMHAKAYGVLDEIYPSLETMARHVDLLILATPLSLTLSLASQIAKVKREMPHSLTVLDVGSVKRKISAAFEALSSPEIEFVPSHPMAGLEKNGFRESHENLFANASWILTPHSRLRKATLEKMEKWIASLGACPVYLSAEEHDKQTAIISHLPYLLSRHYLEFVLKTAPDALKVAGPGFHSFTRIAHDNPKLRQEIYLENRDLIETYLENWLVHHLNPKEDIVYETL